MLHGGVSEFCHLGDASFFERDKKRDTELCTSFSRDSENMQKAQGMPRGRLVGSDGVC